VEPDILNRGLMEARPAMNSASSPRNHRRHIHQAEAGATRESTARSVGLEQTHSAGAMPLDSRSASGAPPRANGAPVGPTGKCIATPSKSRPACGAGAEAVDHSRDRKASLWRTNPWAVLPSGLMNWRLAVDHRRNAGWVAGGEREPCGATRVLTQSANQGLKRGCLTCFYSVFDDQGRHRMVFCRSPGTG